MNSESEPGPLPGDKSVRPGPSDLRKAGARDGGSASDNASDNANTASTAETTATARGGRRRQRQRQRQRQTVIRGLLGALLIMAGYISVTMYPYLTNPGTDPLNARVAEWARDHGMSRVITWLENETYTPPATGGKLSPSQLELLKHKAAKTGGTAADTLPGRTAHSPTDLPANITPLASGQIAGEGVWQPVVFSARGEPIVETAALRPDPEHTSSLAYVAWMNHNAVTFSLHPGYQQPGGDWSVPDWIPASQRAGLVATFNGGFKVVPDDALGGFYDDGRTAVPLVDGRAAEVFYRDGTMKIGAWDRDEYMQPDVTAVRENLNLLVDDGRVTVGPYDGSGPEWGYTIMGWYYIARSGVGMTANGDIVYVGGQELSVYTLAKLLKAAGAVYGMELDINPTWVSFMTYNGISAPDQPTPTKLWDFNQPGSRYFEPSDRDFVSVSAR